MVSEALNQPFLFRLFPLGMPGGEMTQQGVLEFLRALFLFRVLPAPVIQVSRAFDVRVLQRVRPAAQLARTVFRKQFQI